MSRKTEVEIKLALASPRAAARELARLGFRRRGGRQFERNWIFDDERGSLRRAQRLFRLRRRGAARRAFWTLTAKGPVARGRYKAREEAELALPAGGEMAAVLAVAGFHPVFIYDRYRTVFADGHGEASLDETVAGCFLELEGPPRWIDRVAAALGRGAADYITASYVELLAPGARRGRGAPLASAASRPSAVNSRASMPASRPKRRKVALVTGPIEASKTPAKRSR